MDGRSIGELRVLEGECGRCIGGVGLLGRAGGRVTSTWIPPAPGLMGSGVVPGSTPLCDQLTLTCECLSRLQQRTSQWHFEHTQAHLREAWHKCIVDQPNYIRIES